MGKKQSTKLELLSLRMDESDLPVTVTRRPRQKHIRIRVSFDGKINLSAPLHTSLREIDKALKQKEEWISSKLLETAGNIGRFDPLERVHLCGDMYTVHFFPDGMSLFRLSAETGKKELQIFGPSPDRKRIELLIEKWLRQEAKKHLLPLALEISADLGIPYKRLFLRNQYTRWGSSSSIGNISLNWRAVMLPANTQRYLIIHELVHQLQLNHSPRFWRIVEKHCPGYRDHEKTLKNRRAIMGLFRPEKQ